MGDRTFVRLTVATKDVERVEQLMGDEWHYDYVEEQPHGLTSFDFNEINYGELRFLEDLKEPLAYDSEWSAGGDYGAGGKYSRINKDGTCKIKEIYVEDDGVSLLELIKARDNDRIDELIEREKRRIYVMHWKEQLEILERLQQ